MSATQKQQVVALLKSIETGDSHSPVRVRIAEDRCGLLRCILLAQELCKIP
jgi:hypothetical protein